ncbi:MAG: FAD:protein FMN transferase [Coriobacteriales bacterium]|jgi:thiamine biosynthesis lipoprotein|nr:FAD:protein FMN transferase [Coriobacteriales bacterium]
MLNRRRVLALSFVGMLSLLEATLLSGCLDKPGQETDPSANPPTDSATGERITELKTFSSFLFDTYIEIRAACEQQVLDSLNERLIFFENTFSRTREGSDIYRINSANGKPTEIHEETAFLIEQARIYSELTNGLFDITIGAVSSLWDFKEGIVPDEAVLAAAVNHVDFRAVKLSGTTVTLEDAAARLDLGGIAKGYAADEMARMLREAGCESALINLGGNIYALGLKPDGSPWNVGIQDPLRERGAIKAVVPARDLSVVTSGPYERGFERNGVRYHHILDPRSGYPVVTDLASSTIISERSIEGDALTTCCFLLGLDAACDLVQNRSGVDALLVDAAGEVTMTDNTIAELI